MSPKYLLAALGLSLALAGCAQSSAPSRSFNDPLALRYINDHGVLVDVQVPAKDLVTASMIIDAKTALTAQQSSQNVVNAARGTGLAGLLIVSALSTQMGSATLERNARDEARKDAQPMAALIGGQPLDTRLQARYRQASIGAGLRPATNAIAGRLLIRPNIILEADRASFRLFNEIELQDIAGSALYHARIEVISQSFRRCGVGCVDDGELDLNKVMEVLDGCIDESMKVLAQDIQTQGVAGKEQTLRYVLNGQRHVERGQLLSSTDGYTRYRSLDGAVRSAPVQLEGTHNVPLLQQIAGAPAVQP